MFKIDKGIKPVQRRNIVHQKKAAVKSKYPFDQMAVGDSFAIPVKDRPPHNVRNAVFAALQRYRAENGNDTKSFITREMPGNVIRVWRVV